jgi:tripartite-type tricarboxylate transporter receptor subunit TctC
MADKRSANFLKTLAWEDRPRREVAAANGYTIVLGNWNTHVANGAIYALPYDLVKDFEPVALIGSAPMLIVAKGRRTRDESRT